MIYNSSNNLNDVTTAICIKAEHKDWIRTSFFIKFKNNNIPYMVLNKHVLEKNDIITVSLPMKGKIIQRSISNNAKGKIIFHPQRNIDLCIIKVSDLEYKNRADEDIESIKSLTEDMILTKNEISQLNYCEDVIMFGSPGGIYDSQKNLSVATRGTTSTPPDLGFKRKDNFYVNISSYPGSCGSPIFLCNSETMQDFSKTKLLGVFCETQNMLSKDDKTQYMNLGFAVPAYYLLDFKQLI